MSGTWVSDPPEDSFWPGDSLDVTSTLTTETRIKNMVQNRKVKDK